jgi:hypothetical protein
MAGLWACGGFHYCASEISAQDLRIAQGADAAMNEIDNSAALRRRQGGGIMLRPTAYHYGGTPPRAAERQSCPRLPAPRCLRMLSYSLFLGKRINARR